MRFIALTMLALTLACAEAVKLPPDAQAAIDKADKAAAVVQQKADADIVKIRQTEIVSLTKAQEAATKKGDLETAMAIKAKVDAANKAMGDLIPAPPEPVKEENPLVGTWQVFKLDGSLKCQLQVDKDMTTVFERPAGIAGKLSGRLITWANGSTWSLSNSKGAWTAQANDGVYKMQK